MACPFCGLSPWAKRCAWATAWSSSAGGTRHRHGPHRRCAWVRERSPSSTAAPGPRCRPTSGRSTKRWKKASIWRFSTQPVEVLSDDGHDLGPPLRADATGRARCQRPAAAHPHRGQRVRHPLRHDGRRHRPGARDQLSGSRSRAARSPAGAPFDVDPADPGDQPARRLCRGRRGRGPGALIEAIAPGGGAPCPSTAICAACRF